MSDNELDSLFKEAAEGFKAPNDPTAWKHMAKKLDQAAVGGSGFWNWKTISSLTIAGLTGVAVVWYVSQSQIGAPISNGQSSLIIDESRLKSQEEVVTTKLAESQPLQKEGATNGIQKTQDAQKSSGDPATSINAVSTTSAPANRDEVTQQRYKQTTIQPNEVIQTNKSHQLTGNTSTGVANNEEKSNPVVSSALLISGADSKKPSTVVNSEKSLEQNISNDSRSSSSSNSNLSSSATTSNSKTSNEMVQLPSADSVVAANENSQSLKRDSSQAKVSKEEANEKRNSGRGFSIKIAIAPDYTTVEKVTPDKLGLGYGVLVEYRFSNNWSVATGGIWSKKIYSAENVEHGSYTADRVDGDCRMWDIPVNAYYTFSPTRRFSFYAGLGLSSYIMNEENYVMYYETSYGTYDYSLQVKGENNEWFKTLNASIGMQLRLNNRFSIQVEPTIKAPLAGVGEGEVSLASFGAFFNLKYDLSTNKSVSE